MILESPGAILCQIGPFPVRYYGMMIGLGFVIALFFAGKLAKKMSLSADTLVSLALYSFIFGIVGARLYYVILSLGHFIQHPLQIFATWNGGLAIHGGIIGGVIAGCLYLRSKKLPILPYADVMGACIPLAQALGRWGNFFNSELYGLPVAENFPLKLHIPMEYRLPQYQAYEYFHPTFLYESIWDFFLFLFLYFYFIQKNKSAPGMTFFMYLAAYSIGRIFIEQLRIDAVSYVFSIPTPILASAATLVFSLCAMLNIYNRAQSKEAISPPEEKSEKAETQK